MAIMNELNPLFGRGGCLLGHQSLRDKRKGSVRKSKFVIKFSLDELSKIREQKFSIEERAVSDSVFLYAIDFRGLVLGWKTTSALLFNDAFLAIVYLKRSTLSPRLGPIAKIERIDVRFRPGKRERDISKRFLQIK